MLNQKRFVYVLRNDQTPPRYYTGVTSDVPRRHAEHNAGNCDHTAKYRPWSVEVVIEFADERRGLRALLEIWVGSDVEDVLWRQAGPDLELAPQAIPPRASMKIMPAATLAASRSSRMRPIGLWFEASDHEATLFSATLTPNCHKRLGDQ